MVKNPLLHLIKIRVYEDKSEIRRKVREGKRERRIRRYIENKRDQKERDKIIFDK